MIRGNARTAVVTGASSGIGKEVAKALACAGWRIIGTGRDPARMAEAEAEISAAGSPARIEMLAADLSLLAEASELADKIAQRTDRIDLLVNNAGGMTDRLVMTAEGLEASYAANHLGPFVLTARLLPLLTTAAAGAPSGSVRILQTASDASEMIPSIDLDDLQNLNNFNPGLAYCAGKLANVLFTKGLAMRLQGSGIVAHAVAPGAVDSNFYEHAPQSTREHMRDAPKLTAKEGADTLIWLATCEEGGDCSGGYWEQRKPRPPHALANDLELVGQFWARTEKMVEAILPRS